MVVRDVKVAIVVANQSGAAPLNFQDVSHEVMMGPRSAFRFWNQTSGGYFGFSRSEQLNDVTVNLPELRSR